MKIRTLLLGAIFMLLGLTGRAQIVQMLSQSFENGETENFAVSPSAGEQYSTTLYTSGARSLHLVQQSDSDVELVLDTLDFTQNTELRYIALRFDHMAILEKNKSGDYTIATIKYKLAHQTDAQWKTMGATEYDMTGETYSSAFVQTLCFNENSYDEWRNFTTVENSQWRSERFNLNNVITPTIPTEQRKLLIKFVLKKRDLTTTLDADRYAWWIDNISVAASAEQMVSPRISMLVYPYCDEYPNSRGARIVMDATTTMTQGLNPDSIYIDYLPGSSDSSRRIFMQQVAGNANRYMGFIPFFGYDTLMRFRCEVRDNSNNINAASFPNAKDAWISYHHIRGVERHNDNPPDMAVYAGSNSAGTYPFPDCADMRCEIIYDSATMRGFGYGPGAITSFKFIAKNSSSSAQQMKRMQVKMKNVPSSFEHDPNVYVWDFYKDYMPIAYDDAYTLPQAVAGDTINFQLQDTFYYTGSDILMLITIDNDDDPSGLQLKMADTPNSKKSLSTYQISAFYGADIFTAESGMNTTSNFGDRPIFLFNEEANMPLLYDAGISGLVDPNYDLAMVQRPGSITVKLKNYGANALTGVRISYSIDDTTTGYYDWSGNLGAGAEEEVKIADKEINMPAGFHVLKVWVEDTVASGSYKFRDHEPYNDTISSPFIICDGPLGGIRNIGGEEADYNDIDEFLFSLKRCGINDSLVVRVAPGEYPPFTIPVVTGLTEEHYIVFEAMDSLVNPVVVFGSNSTQTAAVDLQNVHDIRFRRIDFERRSGASDYMADLTSSAVNVHFEKCRFTDSLENPSADLRINAMIHSKAGNLTVDSCLFEGGRIGVEATGTSATDPTVGIVLHGNVFRNQHENALRLEYIYDVTVEGNEMYDVVSNTNAVMLVNTTDGDVKLVSNKIFTSHGASALAINNVSGTSASHAVIANNMIVGEDDGTAGLMRTLVNIAQGSYIDIVYNSVKLNGPTRGNVAAVTFGGSGVNNCMFANNIVASVDKVNYALNYQPGTDITNEVHHNVYFSKGTVLNRRGGTNCLSLAAWITAEPADTTSVTEDPVFLNAGVVDLRTFKRSLMGIGIPIATVPEDMFGNIRGIDSTCPGAFEFSALAYDFTPLALLNPADDNCSMPEQVELRVRLMNDGVNDYTSETERRLTLSWQVNGGTIHSVEVDDEIDAEGLVDISTGSLYNMPPNGIYDSLYIVRFWTSFADDPNPTNDTVDFRVYSRYHPAAPAEVERWVDYAMIDTITITNGLDEWNTYNHSGAPLVESKVYWYLDSTSTEPFFTGKTFVTDQIRQDTVFYIRQRRSLPVLRFTQLEMSKTATAAGPTSPMPSWMSDTRRMALEITNVGDATAYLEGDTLLMVSPTANLNNKIYRFGNVKIEPGKTLVVQFAASAVTDSSVTIHTDINPTQLSYSSNIGLVYISNGTIVEALAVNSVVTTTSAQSVKWSTLGIPSYVWTGSGVGMVSNTAGMIRVAFNGNADDWMLSSEDFPMHLGQADRDWLMFQDMGCEGDVAKVKINAVGVPLVDLSVDEIILPEGGCNMGDEEVSVRITNYGINTVNGMTVNYKAGDQIVSENIDADLATNADTLYTFLQPVSLKFDHDSTVDFVVWVSHNIDDMATGNDTVGGTVHTKYTPDAPTAIVDHEIGYGLRDTIYFPGTIGVSPVWYNSDLIPVDTGFVHITDIIYENTTIGVSLLVNDTLISDIGTDQVPNEANVYPSPYQSYYKNARQQYIYSASELHQAGLRAGFINKASFYLDTVLGSSSSVTLKNYKISVDLTSDTLFETANGWKIVANEVFYDDEFVVGKSESHSWIEHPFSTPFYWDGESSLVVQIDYSLDAAYTSGVRTYYSEKNASSLYKAQNSALPSSTGNGTVTARRPNIRLQEVSEGCNGGIATFSVQPVDIPDVDAAISWEDGYDTVTFSSCEQVEVSLILHSQGTSSLGGVELRYSLDGAEEVSSTVEDVVASGESVTLEFFSQMVKPGVHKLKAYITAEGDAVYSNDTIERDIVVRLCGGDYIVSQQSEEADFITVSGMLDTLHEVGILGPVVFHMPDSNYTEQVTIHEVFGSSEENTITLKGDGETSTITAATSSADNYVVLLDNTKNIILDGITLRSAPASGNFANVLVVDGSSNVRVENSRLVVASTVVNANASTLVMNGDVENFIVTNSVLDSGYYSISNVGALTSARIENNEITNFANYGINLRNVKGVTIEKNIVRSSNSSNDRALTGIQVSSSTDSLNISKNQIYLIDDTKGGKRGIQLNNVVATAINPGRVTNNMIGTHSTDSKGLSPTKSAGIWIDSSSTYVNVYFNTVSVYATASTNNTANDASYALHTGASTSHLEVTNNVLYNSSYGYAYHMLDATNVVSSNNNAFFSKASNPFYIKQTNYSTLAALQAANSDDGQSLFEEPFFEAEDDLRLTISAFVGKGQYNPDVPDDIFDTPRGQNPPPTIGAVQMFLENHDIAILNVVSPYFATGNASPYIETDSVSVVVTFYNNGASTENNVKWYAYVDGNMGDTRSADKVMNNFLPLEARTDTVKMPIPRGLVYDQTVLIFVECTGDTIDNNNSVSSEFYIRPAFNIAAKLVRAPSGCGLKKAPISIQLKNEGLKPIPSGSQIKIGYGASVTSPANYTVSTMPSKVEQTVTLTAPLAVGDTLGYTFTQRANLYPTDSAIDIKVRVRGWAKYQYDLIASNDTTSSSSSNSPIKDSYFVPADPQGHDTTLAYGTWGKIWAEQANGLPVLWYRDTTAKQFFTGSVWSNSPQYFHDSTYYLRCVSSKGCSSAFKMMTVSVGSLMQNDMACEAVLKPIGSRVYMENDTVRVRVANYGSSTQSNVPVVFELRRGNDLIQKVSENIPASIASHQTYEYTFNTLLDIPTPTSAQTYTLKAYTNLNNDGARANDTVHLVHTFTSLSQDRYNNRDWTPDAEASKFDITRLSFNSIDIDMPYLNRTVTDMAGYDSPEYPVLHVSRGTTDSILLQVTPNPSVTQRFRCRATVAVDLDRNGFFSHDTNGCDERLIDAEPFWNDSVFRAEITIPECASYGYMRMRVQVSGYDPSSTEGHVIDLLLFVDAEVPSHDIAITQMVTPRDFRIENDNPTPIAIRLTNKGKEELTELDIYYRFEDVNYQDIINTADTIIDDITGDTLINDTTGYGVYRWMGSLPGGQSTVVTLPSRQFEIGATTLTIWHEFEEDADESNNTIEREYYRFHEIEVTLKDNFDDLDLWYAPRGYNEFSRNFWQHAKPNKNTLKGTHSGEMAWVTDATKTINTGVRGNVSYLYSPIIDNTSIRPDTIAFYMVRNLTGGSEMHIEFLNAKNQWQKLETDSSSSWYNDSELLAFSGSSSSYSDYSRYYTSSTKARPDYRQGLQFRIVYTTPLGNNSGATFGDGCAIDDFFIGRGRRAVDVGVTGITYPDSPRFGRTYQPKVDVHNYGTDTIRNLQIGYIHYGAGLSKVSTLTCELPPDATQEFELLNSFEVTSDYPDSFYIVAFTINNSDLYLDNDTASRLLHIMPLNGDISAEELIEPTAKVVAGDTTVPVTLRLRNFGINPIHSATACYTVNGKDLVCEQLDFEQLLGGPLESMEYYNYTFEHKLHATMGTMDIECYLECDGNEYSHNDTVFKRINGIMAVTDLAATAIFIDESTIGEYHIAVEIENRGTRGANNFIVGYWIDDDLTTLITEDYIRATPLPALSKGYYLFNYFTIKRPESIKAMVYIDGDNNRTNDTTDVLGVPNIDIAVKRVIVEENAAEDCRLFLEVTNVGNVPLVNRQFVIEAVVNGNTVNTVVNQRLEAGQTYTLPFNRRIPKSLQRSYVGTGRVSDIKEDTNSVNDMTSVVQVVNYVEGIQSVRETAFVLEQNRPNPFHGLTTVPFSLPRAADVRFFVVDALGHTLHQFERRFAAGDHSVTLNLEAYPAGVYYYGIEMDGIRQMRKMIVR